MQQIVSLRSFSLYCSHLIVSLASPKILALGNEKKNMLFFYISLVFSYLCPRFTKVNNLKLYML